MARDKAPTTFDNFGAFVDPERLALTDEALNRLLEIWRQVCAGFVIVPVTITQPTSVNTLELTPRLQKEGGTAYGNGMAFYGKVPSAITGAAQARVGARPYANIYKNFGRAAAGVGDILAGDLCLFIYEGTLNTGAGGFLLK